ncbi:MAG TPA: hypothetical protein VNK04_14445 [Gemmataceae bacterium]|nr:hypothetical protein [Gemmataceae bacterium]
MRTKSALLAFGLLTAAILRSGAAFDLPSLVLVLAALLAALTGCTRRQPETVESFTLLPWLLGSLVAVELVWLGLRPESAFLPRDRLSLPPFLAALLIGLLALSYTWKDCPWPRGRFAAVLVVYFALGAWLLTEAAPEPAIDVWHFQQRASACLLRGDNPYTAEYPNPYSHTRFFGEEMVKDGKIQTFPYPPLSLLLVLPGYLAGDVRWSLLLAMVGTAGVLVAVGRQLGLPAGHPAELAAIAFLCNPWGVAVVELAWTEPLLALAASLGVWALASGQRRVVVLALTGVISLKQYGFLLLPAFMASRRVGWKDVARAATLAGLIALPFLVWDPRGFWHGIVEFHFYTPLREDSLSVLAAVAVATGQQFPGWLGLGAAAAVAGWLWRRGAPALAGVALGSAATILAFFVFNRAAHLNYYWLALMFLALAVITAAAEDHGRTVPDPQGDFGGHHR